MDLYLKEISIQEKVGNFGSDFSSNVCFSVINCPDFIFLNISEQQLIAVCTDLFAAGSESTSNSIAFAMLYMLLYPDVQDKVRQELDSIVGRNRLPSYTDRLRSVNYVNLEFNGYSTLKASVYDCRTGGVGARGNHSPTDYSSYCIEEH